MSFIKHFERDRRINKDSGIEIPVYGPHDLLCAQDYKLSPMFVDFEQSFEQYCKTWLKNATPDMFNKAYMDSLITEYEKEGLISLDIQEVDHLSVIYELGKVWVGDRIKAEMKLNEITKEKAAIDYEILRLEKIYYNGTIYDAYYHDTVKEAEHE